MGNVSLAYNFVNDTTADALEVMANFNAILAQVNGNIEQENLADDSVGAGELIDGSVGPPALAANAVTTPAIADGAVTGPKIPDNAIVSAKIPTDAVTTAKIPDNAVTTAKIPDDAITAPKIAAGAVGVSEIADNSVGVGEALRKGAVRAKRTTFQSVSSGITTAIALNEADIFDPDNYHDIVTNNTRLTVPAGKDGIYLVIGEVSFDTSGAGERRAFIYKNGALFGTGAVPVTTPVSVTISTLVSLVAGDYVELFVYQAMGGASNVGPSFLSAIWLDKP